MEAGTQVRLKNDPGRTGFLTGKKRPRGPDRFSYQVKFSNGYRYIPEEKLEPIQIGTDDPIDLLAAGRVGRALDLRQALTHVRLTGRLADLIYSMEITNTDFYAYQFKPVLKMLNAPNQGLLIADEVGLGKTIEAGLIWTELRTRFDLDRILVLCPAMLREKWRRELLYRFGVEADILDARQTLTRLQDTERRRANSRFAIIASMQGLRPSKGSATSQDLFKYLDDQAVEEPLIDFLVVDEAHYFKNPESKTARLGRRLRRLAQYVAFLSATPIHLGSRDLFQLLNLLDEDTFNYPTVFDSILNANGPLVEARDQVLSGRTTADVINQTLASAKAHPLLAHNRQLSTLLEDPATDERLKDETYRSRLAYRLEEINLFSHTVTRMRKRDVNEWRVVREPVAQEIPLSAPEAAFYERVTRLVREYCARENAHEGFLLVAPQRQMSSSMPAALRSWRKRKALLEEQLYEDIVARGAVVKKPGPLMQELFAKVEMLGDLDALWKNDSKYHRLRQRLRRYFAEHPTEKVVLFSYFRDTLTYLHERLQEEGIESIVLMGGSDYDKDAIIDTFRRPDGPQILLSSEVASEGVDLQFSRVLINYDLPWNPMKIEQRIGRIDRLGQEAQRILVWNLFYGNTIDARIYHRLFQRLKIFEFALGGIEPILGDEMRELTFDLMRDQLTPEQEDARIVQTAQALAIRRDQEEQLENEAAHLLAHGDYILNQVQASRRLNRWVSGDDLLSYVISHFAVHYPGCDFRQLDAAEPVFDVRLSTQAKYDLEKFIGAKRLGIPTQLIHSDPRPVRCRFENRLARPGRVSEEIINHFHPLVRFVSHTMDERGEVAYPALAVKLSPDKRPEALTPGTYVFSIQRWSIRGLQDQEKLYYTALGLGQDELLDDETAERLVVKAALEGIDWPEAPNQVDFNLAAEQAQNRCLAHADQQYELYSDEIRNKNEDLADVQEQTLISHLDNQRTRLYEIRDDMLRQASHPGLMPQRKQNLENLAKAREGQVRRLEERCKRRQLRIQEGRDLKQDKEDIAVGVIKVA